RVLIRGRHLLLGPSDGSPFHPATGKRQVGQRQIAREGHRWRGRLHLTEHGLGICDLTASVERGGDRALAPRPTRPRVTPMPLPVPGFGYPLNSTLALRRWPQWRSAWENNWPLAFSHFGCESRHAKTRAALPAISARWRHTKSTVPHLLDSE